MFYVYILLDPRKPGTYTYDGFNFKYEPFYVGKGHGRRAFEHTSNVKKLIGRYKTYNVPKEAIRGNRHKFRRIANILKDTGKGPKIVRKIVTSDNEAIDFEIELIKAIGRRQLKQGPLTNLSNGGEGPAGRIASEEEKEKRRHIAKEYWADPKKAKPLREHLRKKSKEFWNNASDEFKKEWSETATLTNIEYRKIAPKEKLEQHYKAISEGHKKRTKEEREAYAERHRQIQLNLPEEKKQEMRRKMSKKSLAANARRTPEQKERIKRKLSRKNRAKWVSYSQEERENRIARVLEKRHWTKTQKEKDRINEKISNGVKRKHNAMSERDRVIRRYMVMCGNLLKNCLDKGIIDEENRDILKEKLRYKGEKFYTADRLHLKPTNLREKVRTLILNHA